MAKRTPSRLAEGTTILDYASPARIMKAFGNDMKAIRAEASRQRSILRKRVERMREAGETYNQFYKRYGDVASALPSIKNLSDAETIEYLRSFAQGLSGGYLSTVRDIREERKDIQEAMRQQAKDVGDWEFVQALSSPISPQQMANIGRMTGMVMKVVGRVADSDTVYRAAMKIELGRDKKESLLTKATRVMESLGIIDGEKRTFESVRDQFSQVYNEDGTDKYAHFSKSRRKRG